MQEVVVVARRNLLGELLILTWQGVAVGLAFGLPLPSMKHFMTSGANADPPGLGESSLYYALAISLFAGGEMLGSTTAGYLNRTKPIRSVFLLVTFMGICGGGLYAIAQTGWMVIVARILTGFWSGGVNVLIRVYIHLHIPHERVTFILSLVSFAMTLAMGSSPALSVAFISLPRMAANRYLAFDEYRAPGWCIVLFSLFSLLCMCCCFSSNDHQQEQIQEHLLPEATKKEANDEQDNEKEEEEEKGCLGKLWNANGVPNSVIIAQLFAFFVSSFGFVMLETMTTPLMSDQFGIGISGTSLLFVVAGIASACSFALLVVITNWKWVTDTQLLLFSSFALFVGFFTLTDFQSLRGHDVCQDFTCSFDPDILCPAKNVTTCPESLGCVWLQKSCSSCPPVCRNPSYTLNFAQMYCGVVLINIAFILGRIVSGSIYTKLMQGAEGEAAKGKEKKKSFMYTILNNTGVLAKIGGPLLAVVTYEAANFHTYLLMCLLAGLCLIMSIWFCCVRNETEYYSSSLRKLPPLPT